MNMTILAGACLVALALASRVDAASFSPSATSFKLTGTVQGARNDRPQQCSGVLKGVTGAAGTAGAKIRPATFTSTSGCGIVATGLPWTLTATGPGAASLAGLAITLNGIACGPDTIPITIDANGVFGIRAVQMRHGCSFIATLPSKPKITVTP